MFLNVHKRHCCLLNGCKYGEDDCPVTTRTVDQEHCCDMCGFEKISSVQEVKFRFKSLLN